MLVALLSFGQVRLKLCSFFPNNATFFKLFFLKKLQVSPKKMHFSLEAVGLQERNATNTTMKFK